MRLRARVGAAFLLHVKRAAALVWYLFKNSHCVREKRDGTDLMHCCTESTTLNSSRHGFCANAGMAPAGATRSPLAGRIGLLENGGWQNKGQLCAACLDSSQAALALSQIALKSLVWSTRRVAGEAYKAWLRLPYVCASSSKEGQPNAQEGQPKTRRRDTSLKERVGRTPCRLNTKVV